MVDSDKTSRTGVIVLKPLEPLGVRLETRAVKVNLPGNRDRVQEIKLASKPHSRVTDAIFYANGLGLVEMGSRSLPGRDGGVFQLMDTRANHTSDYVISGVKSIGGELPFDGRTYWVIEELSNSDRQYLFRPVLS